MSPTAGVEPGSDSIQVEVIRDGRLRTRLHWEWNGDRVRIRVPHRIPQQQLDQHVAEIVEQVKQKRAQVRGRADAELEAIARRVNRAYLGGEIAWHSIRWVSNMHKRLGSCTVSGPTRGDIRISDRLKGWPLWVLEYVIVHELTHIRYPNHSPDFWAAVHRYPQAERARGFVLGVAFQQEEDAEEWL
jgi:predicted metal-dependent hydrolase